MGPAGGFAGGVPAGFASGFAGGAPAGGLAGGTLDSRGELSEQRTARQWDFPYGWAPHQMLVWRGLLIAYRQEDLRDRLLAFGVVLIIALGAMLNLAVIMGVVPTKGVAMPFLSYGGSSMVSNFLLLGILAALSERSGNHDE